MYLPVYDNFIALPFIFCLVVVAYCLVRDNVSIMPVLGVIDIELDGLVWREAVCELTSPGDQVRATHCTCAVTLTAIRGCA